MFFLFISYLKRFICFDCYFSPLSVSSALKQRSLSLFFAVAVSNRLVLDDRSNGVADSEERQLGQPGRERAGPDAASGLHRPNGPLAKGKAWLRDLLHQVSAAFLSLLNVLS